MTSQLPHFWCLFLSYQLQKNTENGAAVTSLRPFLFRNDFNRFVKSYQFASEVLELQTSLNMLVFHHVAILEL